MLKPRTIISDFDLVKRCDAETIFTAPHDSLISLINRPPENIVGSNHWSQKTDVWSLGIIFYDMLAYSVGEATSVDLWRSSSDGYRFRTDKYFSAREISKLETEYRTYLQKIRW